MLEKLITGEIKSLKQYAYACLADIGKDEHVSEEELKQLKDDIATCEGEIRSLLNDPHNFYKQIVETETHHINETNKKNELIRERLLAMLQAVEDFSPPSPEHTELREYMLRELADGIRQHEPMSLPKTEDPEIWATDEMMKRSQKLKELRSRLARKQSIIEQQITYVDKLDEAFATSEDEADSEMF